MLSSSAGSKDTDMVGAKGGTSSHKAVNVLSYFQPEHLLAGISGGATSSLLLHPLDLLKVRFAVNDGRTNIPQYHGVRNAVVTIIKQEGVRGLYKGVAPNMLGSGTAWGLYFFFYNSTKNWIQGGDPNVYLGWVKSMATAAEAGILTLIITNPIWVVKTRLCLQYGSEISLPPSKRYNGMFDAFSKIYRLEGMRGLYKGFIPGMLGVSHGAVQFMSYEEMKLWYNNYRGASANAPMNTKEYLFFAATSKLIAALVTYPYQVIRARLQDHHHSYAGTWDCISRTWRYEGARGFYKGLGPYLYHVVPNVCVVFQIYEWGNRLADESEGGKGDRWQTR